MWEQSQSLGDTEGRDEGRSAHSALSNPWSSWLMNPHFGAVSVRMGFQGRFSQLSLGARAGGGDGPSSS